MIESEGPAPLLVSLQQLYAAQLAGLQVSPGATKSSVLQGALAARASSPTAPKSHKSSSSPSASVKVSHRPFGGWGPSSTKYLRQLV